MLVIGLLIALAAAIFAGVVLAEDWGGATYAIHGFGYNLGSLTLAGIFLAGIIITTIFFLALYMASVSGRMRRRASARRRAEHRSLREEHENVLAERDRLARELDAERGGRSPGAEYPRDTYSQETYPRATEPVYPRDTDAYGGRVDPANPDAAAYPRSDVTAQDETYRHSV
ncbi:MAG TPA: hypothetical protein VF218_10480 [Acidothermaceae bacterium]|jgi:uncharacterized membrane protein